MKGLCTELIRLPVVCCSCKRLTGWKFASVEQSGQVSHGICNRCGPKLYPNLWDNKGEQNGKE